VEYEKFGLLLNELPLASQHQLGQLTTRNEKSENLFNDNKMQRFHTFHCEPHAAVNPQRPGPQRFTELTDATTNCASNGEIMFLSIQRFFTKENFKGKINVTVQNRYENNFTISNLVVHYHSTGCCKCKQ